MTNSQAVILGIVQGLTEYLPISSSAHLVLIPKIFSWHFSPKEAFIFDVLVQMGTLLGVLVYFKDKILAIIINILNDILKKKPFKEENAQFGLMVLWATLPATIVGLFFKEEIAPYFSEVKITAICLIFTGILLILAEVFKPKREKKLTFTIAFLIGLMQCLALLPGISRSGSTIASGMLLGLSRKKSAEFSFFMSMPVMLGAGIIALDELIRDSILVDQMLTSIVLGFIAAAISGYLVIKWFMHFITNKSLLVFAYYCLIIGFLGVWFYG